MSAADIEVIREMLDAFNREDYDRSTALVHDQMLIDCGDRVFARGMLRGRGRESGVELEEPTFHIYEVRDELIIRIQVLFKEDEPRSAAGLEAP